MERQYISKYNAVDDDNYYNLSYGGECISGRTHSEKTIRKISNSKKQNYIDDPTLGQRIANRNPMTPSTREALLKANTGRKKSAESRKAMSISAKKRYENDGRKYPALINKNTGEIIPEGINIRKLARKLNMNNSSLYGVISGNRNSCFGRKIMEVGD